ncbi:MAG: hypothetical protein L3I91_02725 [Mycoplasma sp.]
MIININNTNLDLESKLPILIGSFDVIHDGHLLLFNKVKNKQFNVLLVINSPNKTNFLNSLENRITAIKKLGARNIYVFDVSLNNLTANEFIKQVLLKIKPSKIIVGSDFKFGKDQQGSLELLKQHFNLDIVQVDHSFKTKNIKELWSSGKIDQAQNMIRVPIVYQLKIIKGKQLSRLWGFPTLNSELDNNLYLPPKAGSYLSKVVVNNETYFAATYVGNPIQNKQRIEVHAFVNNKNKLTDDLYGQSMSLTLLDYVNEPFNCKSKEEFKKALITNVELVKKALMKYQ